MAIHALGKGGTEARFLLAAPIASIAQLDRVLVFETMGREFESLWGLQCRDKCKWKHTSL